MNKNALKHDDNCTCWICQYKAQYDDAWEHYGLYWETEIAKFERDAEVEEYDCKPENAAHTITFHGAQP